MSSDPCVDLCAAVGCAMCCSTTANCIGETAGRDRTVGIALGIILGLGTIAGVVLLATTSSTVVNRWTGTYQVISNARYIPVMVIGGGLFTLLAFASAANAKS